MQTTNKEIITGEEAVNLLNEVLEYLESLCDSCDDDPNLYNVHINKILRQHKVFAGFSYELGDVQ